MALFRRNKRSVIFFTVGLILLFAIFNFSSYIVNELDSMQMKMELKHRLIDLYKDCHYRILPLPFIFGNLAKHDVELGGNLNETVLMQILWETSVVCPPLKLYYGFEDITVKGNATWTLVEPTRALNTKDYYHSIYDQLIEVPYGKTIYYQIIPVQNTTDGMNETNHEDKINIPNEIYHTIVPAEKERGMFKIGVVADSQSGILKFKKVLSKLFEQLPDVLFHVGDYTQNGQTPNDWRTQFLNPLNDIIMSDKSNEDEETTTKIDDEDETKIVQRKITPISYCRGNHDNFLSQYGIQFKKGTKLPLYYSQMYASSLFIFLDSNEDSLAQYNFLNETLASDVAKDADFRVVFVHIPPYIEYWDKKAWNDKEEKNWGRQVREKYVPLFQKYKVDLVVGGHSHMYQRGIKDDIHYAIVGGAGGSLENKDDKVEDYGFYNSSLNLFEHHFVTMQFKAKNTLFKPTGCSTLVWQAFNEDNVEKDTFTITSKNCDRR